MDGNLRRLPGSPHGWSRGGAFDFPTALDDSTGDAVLALASVTGAPRVRNEAVRR